ncbi:hypothetical protein DNI29_11225 [Hymenobacter sediminis]|uniref:hypothetical protein n=1 Tax=Hymenobacter sediminis TaxID=2218621 RepID=UPI000DA6CC4E|nr:hypothetical protein [Hymenobacter sediminis]RPD47993.1 hypothetical protein DNI29_11225 [Hymenobacter sediminis]
MKRIIDLFREDVGVTFVLLVLCLYIFILERDIFDATVVTIMGINLSEDVELDLIYALVVFIIYYTILCSVYEKRPSVKYNDGLFSMAFGCIIAYILLEINRVYASGSWEYSKFKIVSVEQVSVSKTSTAPRVIIQKNNIIKYIIRSDYRIDELKRKKYVLLKYRRGYLGWVVLRDLQIK